MERLKEFGSFYKYSNNIFSLTMYYHGYSSRKYTIEWLQPEKASLELVRDIFNCMNIGLGGTYTLNHIEIYTD